MQIISNIALITINETLIVQAISFLIFLFLLNRIMIGPLRTAITDRDQYLEKTRMGIMDAKQKLIELTDQIAKQESETRKEANGLRHQLESAGTDAATNILSKTRQAIAVEKDKANREMDAQIAATRKSLQAETETLAINVMEKILHRGIG